MVDASVVTEPGGWWRARYGSADRSMYSRSFWIKLFLQRTVRYQPRQGLVIDARVMSSCSDNRGSPLVPYRVVASSSSLATISFHRSNVMDFRVSGISSSASISVSPRFRMPSIRPFRMFHDSRILAGVAMLMEASIASSFALGQRILRASIKLLAVALAVVFWAPVGAQETDPAWTSDLAARISVYRTCWTVVRGIAFAEDTRPSGDRWDFLLHNRDAFRTMKAELDCQSVGYVLPSTYDFTRHRLRPLCSGHLRISDNTPWHRPFAGLPPDFPILVGCIWYHRQGG